MGDGSKGGRRRRGCGGGVGDLGEAGGVRVEAGGCGGGRREGVGLWLGFTGFEFGVGVFQFGFFDEVSFYLLDWEVVSGLNEGLAE